MEETLGESLLSINWERGERQLFFYIEPERPGAIQGRVHLPQSLRFQSGNALDEQKSVTQRSNERHAAIQENCLAGHVVVSDDHENRLRHLVGLAHAPEWDIARKIGPAAHHVGFDERGRYRVDRNAFLDQPRRIAAR